MTVKELKEALDKFYDYSIVVVSIGKVFDTNYWMAPNTVIQGLDESEGYVILGQMEDTTNETVSNT